MKKKFLASVRNLMLAKARLLNVISIAERMDDDKDNENQDYAEHSSIIAHACTSGLDNCNGQWPHETGIVDFLAKEYKEIDYGDLMDDSTKKGYEEFYLDQIKAIKNEFKDEDSWEYYGYVDSVVKDMAKLLLVDGDITNFEKELYIKIAEGLGVKEAHYSLHLTRSAENSKESILETLHVIPDLSKKQIEYIDSEYENLKELHDMSEEDIRDNLPGISKSVARAIKKKLNEAFK
ncbi:hypothetical protein OAY05_00890 [Gammaproteobacteria bacterium]|nr:hypothetical protein [Gammaproteobacteria bacterium]